MIIYLIMQQDSEGDSIYAVNFSLSKEGAINYCTNKPEDFIQVAQYVGIIGTEYPRKYILEIADEYSTTIKMITDWINTGEFEQWLNWTRGDKK